MNNRGNRRWKVSGRVALMLALAVSCTEAFAATIAYWPLAYTAGGRTTTATELTNYVQSTTLVARPISMLGGNIQSGSASCPVGTNAFPVGFAVYDPVAAETRDAETALHFELPANRETQGSGAVRVSNTAPLRISTFTVEFFIRIRQPYTQTQMGQYHAIAVMPRILDNNGVHVRNCDSWGIRYGGNGLQFRFTKSGYSFQENDPSLINTDDYRNFIVPCPALNDGDWHHVALVVNGTSGSVYIDYKPMNDSMTLNGWASSLRLVDPVSYGTEDLYIGAVPMGPQPFGGDIAHFRISDTVLNAADFLRPVRTTPAANEADDVYLHMSFEQEPGFSAGMYFDRTGKQKVIQRRSRFERPCLEPSVPASVLRPSVTNAFAAANATSLANVPDSMTNSNSYLEIRPTSDPFATSSYTVECFYKALSTNLTTTTSTPLLWRYVNDSSAQFRLCLSSPDSSKPWNLNGGIRTDDVLRQITDPTVSATGVWHHAAYVVDAKHKTARLFHDYVRVAETSFPGTPAGAPLSGYIVVAGTSNKTSLNGWVDDVRITLRALTPGEFLTAKEYVDPSARTLAWATFDNGSFDGGPALTNGVGSAAPEGGAPAFSAYQGSPVIKDGAGNVLRSRNLSCLTFSGSQVVWPESSVLSVFPAQTVEFLMRGSSSPSPGEAILRNSLWAKDINDNPGPWLLTYGMTNPSHLRLLCTTINDATGAKTAKGINVDTGIEIADGKWHHIAITFDPTSAGETISIYKDYGATPAWSQTLAGSHIFGKGFGAIWAGAAPFTSTEPNFDGQLDEVRISNGVLSPSEFLRSKRVGFVIIAR